jgi:proline iminopeptidase
MDEPIAVEVAGGALHGSRCGTGRPALLLHGGPAVPDYTGELAAELDGLFATARYTQRGVAPSTEAGPFSIEAHVADAVAVLDALGLDEAWIVGHSWGGHLAMHVAVEHPERVAGLVCVDPLGVSSDLFVDLGAAFDASMTEEEGARVRAIEALRRAGDATEADLLERFALQWPHYFADRARTVPAPTRAGVAGSAGANASLSEHFASGTLRNALPHVTVPALFVHGELDPLPVRASLDAAALIPEAQVAVVPGVGHFPWLERPGCVRDAVEEFIS